MNPAWRSVLALLACHSQACRRMRAAPPLELKRFVEPGTRLLSVDAADLNGDGTQDYLVVLQRGDATGTRPLLIIERDKAGALALRRRTTGSSAAKAAAG